MEREEIIMNFIQAKDYDEMSNICAELMRKPMHPAVLPMPKVIFLPVLASVRSPSWYFLIWNARHSPDIPWDLGYGTVPYLPAPASYLPYGCA